MANETIALALSASEWQARTDGSYERIARAGNRAGDAYYVAEELWDDDTDLTVTHLRFGIAYDGAHAVQSITDDQLPALIALANDALPDDHRNKFTHEDIEALDYLITDVMAVWKAPYLLLFDLRDKLQSILRPING